MNESREKLERLFKEIHSGMMLINVDLSNSGLHAFPSELLQLKDSVEQLNFGG